MSNLHITNASTQKTVEKKSILRKTSNYVEAYGINWSICSKYGYLRAFVNNKHTSLHRYVWTVIYGYDIPSTYIIDHIDRDPSNNDISNLRLLTHQQNSLNRTKYKDSNYKGVTRFIKNRKNYEDVYYITNIQWSFNDTKFSHSRIFNTELEAAREYDRVLLHDAPKYCVEEHDLPGNVAGRFVPILNFEYIDQQPIHSARLVSVTQPTEEIAKELGVNSAEGLLAYVARVSNPSNQSNENVNKLISYCCKNKHFSILETITFTVEITTTKDISSQILRHNSFRFQEFSYRYADSTYLKNPYEIPELRIQDTKDRQKSIAVDDNRFNELNKRVKRHLEDTYNLYNVLLDNGIAKECARRIMPVSMVTRLYMTGNVRDFVFYIKARNSTDGKAQVEHMRVADNIEAIFKEQFPIVYEALFSN